MLITVLCQLFLGAASDRKCRRWRRLLQMHEIVAMLQAKRFARAVGLMTFELLELLARLGPFKSNLADKRSFHFLPMSTTKPQRHTFIFVMFGLLLDPFPDPQYS